MLAKDTSSLYALVMSRAQITTVQALIDHFGGPTETGRRMGGVSAQRVWNWGAAGKLPADLYREHRDILGELGIEVSDELWFGPKTDKVADSQRTAAQ